MFKTHTNQPKLIKTNSTKPNQIKPTKIVKQGAKSDSKTNNFRTLFYRRYFQIYFSYLLQNKIPNFSGTSGNRLPKTLKIQRL